MNRKDLRIDRHVRLGVKFTPCNSSLSSFRNLCMGMLLYKYSPLLSITIR